MWRERRKVDTYESGVDFDAFVCGSVVAGDLEPDGHLVVVEADLNESLVVEFDALRRLFELAFRWARAQSQAQRWQFEDHVTAWFTRVAWTVREDEITYFSFVYNEMLLKHAKKIINSKF